MIFKRLSLKMSNLILSFSSEVQKIQKYRIQQVIQNAVGKNESYLPLTMAGDMGSNASPLRLHQAWKRSHSQRAFNYPALQQGTWMTINGKLTLIQSPTYTIIYKPVEGIDLTQVLKTECDNCKCVFLNSFKIFIVTELWV